MKNLILAVLLITALARVVQAAPVQDLGKSEILSIDREYLKFTVKDLKTGEILLLQITSETRFLLEGKYAISEDLNAGDFVVGKIHKRTDGIYEAVRITITSPKLIAT